LQNWERNSPVLLVDPGIDQKKKNGGKNEEVCKRNAIHASSIPSSSQNPALTTVEKMSGERKRRSQIMMHPRRRRRNLGLREKGVEKLGLGLSISSVPRPAVRRATRGRRRWKQILNRTSRRTKRGKHSGISPSVATFEK